MRAPSYADLSPEEILDDARQRAEAILEEAAVRGSAAWDALRGERVGPPVARSRWPFALAAALAGAAAGIAIAVALRQLGRPDAPDAQDPEDLEAVIDRPVSPGPNS
jgi:hypothetical protein